MSNTDANLLQGRMIRRVEDVAEACDETAEKIRDKLAIFRESPDAGEELAATLTLYATDLVHKIGQAYQSCGNQQWASGLDEGLDIGKGGRR